MSDRAVETKDAARLMAPSEEAMQDAIGRAITDAPKLSGSGFFPSARFVFEAGVAFAAAQELKTRCDEWKIGRAALGDSDHHCAVHGPARCLREKHDDGGHVFKMVGRRTCACAAPEDCVWLADREAQ